MTKNKQPTFAEAVRQVVKKIPAGRVLTYGQVATLAGQARAARAVASVMSKNFDPDIPCHRVIRSDGSLGGYNRGGAEMKLKILKSEGWNGQLSNS